MKKTRVHVEFDWVGENAHFSGTYLMAVREKKLAERRLDEMLDTRVCVDETSLDEGSGADG